MTEQPRSSALLESPLEGEWYPSYQAGMAYCRVTRALAAEAGTKCEKELSSLARLLDGHLGDVFRGQSVQIFDLGTGDGQKMLLTIAALKAAGAGKVRYVPIDTNRHISRYAILNILGGGKATWSRAEVERLLAPINGTGFPADAAAFDLETLVQITDPAGAEAEYLIGNGVVIPASGVEVDFFQDLPRVARHAKQHEPGLRLYCLLGNTFGNYAADQRDAFLAALFRELEPRDLFLLGIGLRPSAGLLYDEQVRLLRREYLPGEAFMRLGADHPQSQYRLWFDPATHSMTHGFERPDRSLQHMGYSHLFSDAEVSAAMGRHGFEFVAQETYPASAAEPQYLTLLVRKPVREESA